MGILHQRKGNLLSSIAACEGQEDLFAALDDLSRNVSRVLARRTAKATDVSLLTGYIVEIRRLLDELSSLPLKQGKMSPNEQCRFLANRFLEIEGMVKELRNDLAAS